VARLAPERAEDFAPFRGALDTVILVNVLERSDAPQAVLRNCFDALEPGGRLVLLAAQCPRLYGPLDRGLGLRRRSSREQTCEGLSAAGFGVERAMEFLRIGLSTWLLYGALLRRPRVPRIELKALDSTVWLWRRADWLLPWPGLHLVVVARKPAAGASAGVPGSP
jgi:SAM-dependent methyltransferase